jgi:SMI1 / KNR4 family (SUKH-1)
MGAVAFSYWGRKGSSGGTQKRHQSSRAGLPVGLELRYDEAMETLFLETFGPLVIAFLILAIVLTGKRLLHELRNRMTPEEAQTARDAFRNRLVHPNSGAVEEALGAFLPERLLMLYNDHPTVLTERIEIRRPDQESKGATEWIEAFLPLDMETQELTMHAGQPSLGKGFCFATDGAGNFYCVQASEVRQADAPVFFAAQDASANEQVAESLEQLFNWPRTVHGEDAESPSRA